MEHLYNHLCAVMRRSPDGEEDGTPIMGDAAAVPWPNAATNGACRLDQPRDVMVTKPDGSRVTIQKSCVMTSPACPVKETDQLLVTTDRGSQTWTVGGIAEAEGQHGAHHIEINVTREVHR